jgi:F0F1-type ATP synthase beta subunit
VLQRYRDLQDIIAILGIDELSEEQKLTVSRARRLQRFMSQPFFVAAGLHRPRGIRYVRSRTPSRRSRRSSRATADDLPEQAFFLAGTLDEPRCDCAWRSAASVARHDPALHHGPRDRPGRPSDLFPQLRSRR